MANTRQTPRVFAGALKQCGYALMLSAAALFPAATAYAQAATQAATDTASAIPRTAEGRPDFSGIWQTLSEADYDLEPHVGRVDAPPGVGVIDLGKLPYRADALAQKVQNFANREQDDLRLKCWSLGVPRSVYYPAPFQIFQRERDITLLHQLGHQVRTIHTNDTLHPEEVDEPFWLGDSRGHWEGDTLVVSVSHHQPDIWLDRAGNYHTEDMHVEERWQFIDANTISYSAKVTDEAIYTQPWTVNVLLHRRRDKGFQLLEDYCFTLPYADYYPHKEGK